MQGSSEYGRQNLYNIVLAYAKVCVVRNGSPKSMHVPQNNVRVDLRNERANEIGMLERKEKDNSALAKCSTVVVSYIHCPLTPHCSFLFSL